MRVVFDPDRPEKIYDEKRWSAWRIPGMLLLFQVFFLALSVRDPELSELVTLKLNQSY